MDPPAPELARLTDLHERGLCLQAYRAGLAFGSLPEWRGTDARVLAGRLARNLGAPRLGEALILRARRQDPGHPAARYYGAYAVLGRGGPLEAWGHLRDSPELEGASPHLRADWCALRGVVLAYLRDFEEAERWIERALAIAPEDPWVHVERSSLLEIEDRYEEALAAALRALELRAWYRPAAQAAAHLYSLLGRDGEALEMLSGAARVVESAPLAADLANLQTELGLHREAWATL
ncbi:MAG: tetratricopeptide repeat protein, partial [Planctomycetes bacterium]|nr:tetratricopeptide repeat protein [Planctomycetota bacterium]